jgi:hypothetical protein
MRRLDIINAGGDPDAIETQILRHGGRIVPAPEPILSGTVQWQPPSREAVAYVFRSDLLD